MNERLLIVSNRLPYGLKQNNQGKFDFQLNDGGLVSGLKKFHDAQGSLWLGWSDSHIESSEIDTSALSDVMAKKNCVPLFLEEDITKGYYDGLSNSTLWPLFHGFHQFAIFEKTHWQDYVRVNELFCEKIVALANPEDTIWIHDYHLMLLPSMLREALPDASIGFFLHIPFPDYETFRMLPWRKEILEGLIGADLIGFHTYDYVRHFMSSNRRILGIEDYNGSLIQEGRIIQVDAFPLGIDYERYRTTSKTKTTQLASGIFAQEKAHGTCKLMLSVERLDYSKGIPNRLNAFSAFLEQYPEWIEKVVLVLVTVPSREGVGSYQDLKAQIDGLVGQINGKFSTSSWTPIDYYYRSIPIELLCSMYSASDVMVVTPLRDGMNLVCKEYLAARDGRGGVLILSEMAGASQELGEAIIVNPFDQQEIVDAMHEALTMPIKEQHRRNRVMQNRIKRYTSTKWAEEFFTSLENTKMQQREMNALLMDSSSLDALLKSYCSSQRRAILLDYDGTLVPFFANPSHAFPDDDLMTLIERICTNANNTVAIISGRDRKTLEGWFHDLPLDLVAEHGAWHYSNAHDTWLANETQHIPLKGSIRATLEEFVDRSPGSFLEEKEHSLVWHFRSCSKELAERRRAEIKSALSEEAEKSGLVLLEGNRIIEIKSKNIDKGRAAQHWFNDQAFDFFLTAGDDTTDEDLFQAAPLDAWTIKIGGGSTQARHSLKNHTEMRKLLTMLADQSE